MHIDWRRGFGVVRSWSCIYHHWSKGQIKVASLTMEEAESNTDYETFESVILCCTFSH